MKIYFAGSIRAGQEMVDIYKELIIFLKNYGNVVMEHCAIKNVTILDREMKLTDNDLYMRDIEGLKRSDLMIAEVTKPSLGVGFEVAKGVEFGKPVVCLFKKNLGYNLSALIAGNKEIHVINYETLEEVKEKLNQKIKSLTIV